jgi:hypothetical protein
MSVPAVFVPTGGGSARARASRRLTRTLRQAGATSEPHAVPLDARSGIEQRQLARLVHLGAVRHGRNGGYWLDEERYREIRHNRIRFVIMVLLIEAGVVTGLLLNLPHHPH